MSFLKILDKYRKIAFSQRDKGERFERLMKAYLLTDPKYAYKFKKVWLWNEFIGKDDLGGTDTGIDLVALTIDGDYWAIQCKCYQEGTVIDKKAIDTFFSTSGREFRGEDLKTQKFSQRLWIDTTGKPFSGNAEETFRNQTIPSIRVGLYQLIDAPVDWSKIEKGISGEKARSTKKILRHHQTEALNKAHEYFKKSDRGKLIMACGTGKTFVSLRIAEKETKGKGLILFLVPSIALLGQILNEWYADAIEPINAICICSDPEVTQNKSQLDDIDTSSVVDLALPASTNVNNIIHQFNCLESKSNKGLTVVFSTYQSIDVISKAQKRLSKSNPKFSQFDLIICDEAHRTTGVTLADEDESSFVKVHDNDFIKAKKRMYMTATPRLYNEESKSKAAQAEAYLCSMDDKDLYGDEIYRIGFGEAVDKDLLSDYKVLILTLNENDVPPAVQNALQDTEGKIETDDVSKLIGCINALSKQILGDEGIIKNTDPEPMRRAVAFCQSIKISKKITNIFNVASDSYISALPSEKQDSMQMVSSKHIDGTMGAATRSELLSWLKSENDEKECKVLTNVRCLSEGVDVPTLDAVLFLSARNSQVDVVQSVGRVMRKSPGKNYGYIIIPIVVPVDVEADKALDDNERYKVVWSVLNALRAHDDRFNATVNKIELNKKRPEQILVGRPETSFDENGNPISSSGKDSVATSKNIAEQISLQFQQLQSVVFARMVQKVGDKRYWEQWAKSVADIAQRQIERITKIIKENPKYKEVFENFLSGLHKNINPSITQSDAIEMLSQHIITKPVFDALFENYSFVKNNPMSQSMQKMLDLLEEKSLDNDVKELEKFYDFAKLNIGELDNAEAKQKIIIRLYDSFFKIAFPKMVEKLGIVYTPIEVVDFIIHSVNDILIKEFGRNISDDNIHILDPFTGTGTFITRLLQSGLISAKDIKRKYSKEIHCNEIVLLAYYIAAVNIENAYHDLLGKDTAYKSFEGICLTDTFQLGETKEGGFQSEEMFQKNSVRVERQKKTPLRIIIGNPPYSKGQKSANDNAQNQSYPMLDKRIADTYAKLTNATNKNSLYNSYIKAFRWSADRLDKTGGIICFVSDGAWIDGNSADGFRKSIENEFTTIYVFNLRGNQRTSGELSRKEGGKIFGSGSRTPIAITLLVKNPAIETKKASIHYYDIGDYLSREEKLKIISGFKSFANDKLQMIKLLPNDHGDWIDERNNEYSSFIKIGERGETKTIFDHIYSNGLKTQRDAWCYNFSKMNLKTNIVKMLEFYNIQRNIYRKTILKNPNSNISKILNFDERHISWTESLLNSIQTNLEIVYENKSIVIVNYRPFTKEFLYYNRKLNERVYQMPKLFPNGNEYNLILCVQGAGDKKEFSVLISDKIADLGFNGSCQCFPLYYYDKNNSSVKGLFDTNSEDEYIRRDAVSDFILSRAKKQYGKNVTKEDIFYYVYGFLHSKEYREKFANDLKRMLPRLPLVDNVRDFWAFSKAGRKLADLHLNYESVPPYRDLVTIINPLTAKDSLKQAGKKEMEYIHYRVTKMRFPRKDQKDSIIYNNQITVDNIPAKAYEYIVNGKSAIEWIMERYQIKTHDASGITNDPNDWAKETGNPRYILDLLLSIVNVSVQSVDIINNLPKINFDTEEKE